MTPLTNSTTVSAHYGLITDLTAFMVNKRGWRISDHKDTGTDVFLRIAQVMPVVFRKVK